MTMLNLQDGGRLCMKDNDEVRCGTHGVVAIWRDLTPIQRLAVEEGIDALDDMPCLLEPKNAR